MSTSAKGVGEELKAPVYVTLPGLPSTPNDVATLRLQVRERGHGQADFTDALALEQDLRQRALWPSASGQCGVERREARRNRRRLGRDVVAAPDRRMLQVRRKPGITVLQG